MSRRRPAPKRAALRRAARVLASADQWGLSFSFSDHRANVVCRSGGDDYGQAMSVAKPLIIAALAGHRERSGGWLYRQEIEWARSAIRYSDNGAANRLWRALGGAQGMLPLTSHYPQMNPGWRHLWGSTIVTPEQLRRFSRHVHAPYGSGGMSNRTKRFLRRTMREVVTAQRWGAPLALPQRAAVKNGWFDLEERGWTVNSLASTKRRTLAVLSEGSPTFAAGVKKVERLAWAVVRAWGR